MIPNYGRFWGVIFITWRVIFFAFFQIFSFNKAQNRPFKVNYCCLSDDNFSYLPMIFVFWTSGTQPSPIYKISPNQLSMSNISGSSNFTFSPSRNSSTSALF